MALSAGTNQSVSSRSSVLLQATGGVGVSWSQVSGLPVDFTYNDNATCAFLAPSSIAGATITMRASGYPTGTSIPTIPNAGFEYGVSAWYYWAGTAIWTQDTAHVHSGSSSGKFIPVTATSNGVGVGVVALLPNTQYTATFYAYSETSTTTLWYLAVGCENNSGNSIGYYMSAETAISPSNWQLYSVTFTTPAATVRGNIEFSTSGNANSAAPIWLDDPQIIETSAIAQTSDVTISVAPHRTAVYTGSTLEMRKRCPDPAVYLRRTTGREDYFIRSGGSFGIHSQSPYDDGLLGYPQPYVEQVVNSNAHNRDIFHLGQAGQPAITNVAVERIEFESHNMSWNRGQTYWWSFAFRVSGSPPANWCNLGQVHQVADAGLGEVNGMQPVGFMWWPDDSYSLTYRYDPATITYNGSSYSGTFTQLDIPLLANLSQNTWHYVVACFKFSDWSAADTTGLVRVWVDGVEKSGGGLGGTTYLGYNDVGLPYPKYGMYRDPTAGAATVEYANVEIGQTNLSARITNPLAVSL